MIQMRDRGHKQTDTRAEIQRDRETLRQTGELDLSGANIEAGTTRHRQISKRTEEAARYMYKRASNGLFCFLSVTRGALVSALREQGYDGLNLHLATGSRCARRFGGEHTQIIKAIPKTFGVNVRLGREGAHKSGESAGRGLLPHVFRRWSGGRQRGHSTGAGCDFRMQLGSAHCKRHEEF